MSRRVNQKFFEGRELEADPVIKLYR